MAEGQAAAAVANPATPKRWGDQIAQLQDDVIDPLARTADFGANGFAPAVEALKVIRKLVTALADQDPMWEKTELAGNLTAHLAEVKRICDNIRAYDGSGDAKQNRQNILTAIDNERGWIAGEVGPAIRVAEVSEANAALQETVATAKQAKDKYDEVEGLVATLRESVGNQGAKELAAFFTTQAKGHADAATRFLWGAVGGIVALVAVAWYVFVMDPISVNLTVTNAWIEFVRQLLPRILALGIAAYLVRFATRNYTVNKHLQVMNEHRSNILKTYPALTSAIAAEVPRDRIAIVLAASVASAIDSGYLKQAEDKGLDSSIRSVMETLRPPSP